MTPRLITWTGNIKPLMDGSVLYQRSLVMLIGWLFSFFAAMYANPAVPRTKWDYFETPKSDDFYKHYEFVEMNVWSTRFQCPKGFFMSELVYSFRDTWRHSPVATTHRYRDQDTPQAGQQRNDTKLKNVHRTYLDRQPHQEKTIRKENAHPNNKTRGALPLPEQHPEIRVRSQEFKRVITMQHEEVHLPNQRVEATVPSPNSVKDIVNDANERVGGMKIFDAPAASDKLLFRPQNAYMTNENQIREKVHRQKLDVSKEAQTNQSVNGTTSAEASSNQQLEPYPNTAHRKGHHHIVYPDDDNKVKAQFRKQPTEKGQLENGLFGQKEFTESVLFTGRHTLTLYDAFYTWFRESHMKSHQNATYNHAGHPARLNVKFESTDDLGITIAEALRDKSYLTWGTVFPRSYGPCAPVVYCLGHQACVFRFSNEFCLTDPLPGSRKVLQLKVRCQRDEVYHSLYWTFRKSLDILVENIYPMTFNPSQMTMTRIYNVNDPLMVKYSDVARSLRYRAGTIEDLRSWPEEVVYVKYESRMEEGIRAYANTSLLPLVIPEEGVFDLSCPGPQQAAEMGYRGNCSGAPVHSRQVTEAMWKNLARTPVPACQRELLQVYCAYVLNPGGHCVPPFLVNHRRTTEVPLPMPRFASGVVPRPGKRFDLSTYKQILRDPHMGLIPARIGFLIMAHNSPAAVFQLVQLIYSSNHYYVIHVDKRYDDVREELHTLVLRNYPGETNIRMIPKSRSFPATWGSYQIQRVQLQGFEELLRLGVWDFAMVVSGSDLPLRSVRDMALALAPYRGNTFVNILRTTSPSSVWHTCDDHVFHIGHREQGLKTVYSHSTWVVAAREFLELVLSARRPVAMDTAQLFLMTSFVPDESYIGTMMDLSAKYSSTMVRRGLHYIKPFYDRDPDNLCRHSDVTDGCGQGPAEFTSRDFDGLIKSSHNFFFARKFSLNISDEIRQHMRAYVTDGFYKQMNLETHFSKEIIRAIVGLSFGASCNGRNISHVVSIRDWRVVPTFDEDPCCDDHFMFRHNKPFRLIADATVLDHHGHSMNIRSSFVSRTRLPCVPIGGLRSIYSTTRPPVSTQADATHPSILDGLPAPTHPPGELLWIFIALDTGKYTAACRKLAESTLRPSRHYFSFGHHYGHPDMTSQEPDVSSAAPDPKSTLVSLDVQVETDDGKVICTDEINEDSRNPRFIHKGDKVVIEATIRCPALKHGWVTISLRQQNIPMAFHYMGRIFVAPEGNPKEYARYTLPEVANLWRFEDIVSLKDGLGENFYKNKELLRSRPGEVKKCIHSKKNRRMAKSDHVNCDVRMSGGHVSVRKAPDDDSTPEDRDNDNRKTQNIKSTQNQILKVYARSNDLSDSIQTGHSDGVSYLALYLLTFLGILFISILCLLRDRGLFLQYKYHIIIIIVLSFITMQLFFLRSSLTERFFQLLLAR